MLCGAQLGHAQEKATDTVNRVSAGIATIEVTAHRWKKKKKPDAEGTVIRTEHFHPDGHIKARHLEEVSWFFDERGRPDSVYFNVIEIGSEGFSRYWRWERTSSEHQSAEITSIYRSRYGQEWVEFRRDSIISKHTPRGQLTERTIYYLSAPDFKQAKLLARYQYQDGKLHQEFSADYDHDGSFRFHYDEAGNLARREQWDEKDQVVYAEQFSYENGLIVKQNIQDEYGKQIDIDYRYEAGKLIEKTYRQADKTYLTLRYRYEMF